MQKAKENKAFVSLFISDLFVDVRLRFDVLAVQSKVTKNAKIVSIN